MFVPLVATRIEQRGECFCQRIKSGEVAGFFEVTLSAGKRKVAQFITATVFDWDNVLNLKSEEWRGFLSSLAVFAPIARPFSDNDSCPGIHKSTVQFQPELCFGLKYGHEVICLDISFILVTFLCGQLSLVGFAGQFVDSVRQQIIRVQA